MGPHCAPTGRSRISGEGELPGIGPFVGSSPAFRAVLDKIHRLASIDATVLIEGETGTGKELAARALHCLGPRRGGPFVPLNCGALPDALIESEIFGHVRGSFTDARDTRVGLIAAAEGGTLMLDEIECLSAKGQAVLLRFLQDGSYRPVGGRDERRSNVRVVVASNCELGGLVRSGRFRADLLYRLAIVSLRMPPLRERPEDIIVLAQHFLRRYAAGYGLPHAFLDGEALAQLRAYAWPGNVRELENVIHGAVVFADGPAIRVCLGGAADTGAKASAAEGDTSMAADAGDTHRTTIPIPFELDYRQAKIRVIEAFERAYVEHALVQAEGNLSHAARITGKERSRLGRLLKKHCLVRTDYAAKRASR
jgi:DNA-binding NtrC family response regulator